MKKIILTLILLLLIPLNTKALVYTEDTTHLSNLMPYYTNNFNNYDYSLYQKAINIINNSSSSYSVWDYHYMILKNYNGTIKIVRFQQLTYKINLKYSLTNNIYTFTLTKRENFSGNERVLISVMNVTSSTTSTSFSGTDQNSFTLFKTTYGYSMSGYNNTNGFLDNYTILYFDGEMYLNLNGTNIYNDNLLYKINTYGSPVKYNSETTATDLYASINYMDYDKLTTEYLKSGDLVYEPDLSGKMYTFSSNTYKNATITVPSNMSIGEGTFDIQFKTDNAKVNTPALYGMYNDKYELITYLDFNYNKFFPTTDIYTLSKNQILVNGEVFFEFAKEYTTFQIRYDLENSLSQNATFIYNGDFELSIDYDTTDFEYIVPGQDENPGFTDNGGWFDRTEDYFNSLENMETSEKLNPIYWLKGIGMILVDLFVPTGLDDSFENIYNIILEKFPIIEDLKSIKDEVFNKNLFVSSEEAPKITIDLEPLGIGLGIFTLIDFAMFDDFISYIRIFISSFLVIELLVWYFKKLGGIFS